MTTNEHCWKKIVHSKHSKQLKLSLAAILFFYLSIKSMKYVKRTKEGASSNATQVFQNDILIFIVCLSIRTNGYQT